MAAGNGGASLFQPREMIPCTSHRGAVRVLDLDPVPRRSGLVGRGKPLRYDAFEANLAGVPEHRGAIIIGVSHPHPHPWVDALLMRSHFAKPGRHESESIMSQPADAGDPVLAMAALNELAELVGGAETAAAPRTAPVLCRAEPRRRVTRPVAVGVGPRGRRRALVVVMQPTV